MKTSTANETETETISARCEREGCTAGATHELTFDTPDGKCLGRLCDQHTAEFESFLCTGKRRIAPSPEPDEYPQIPSHEAEMHAYAVQQHEPSGVILTPEEADAFGRVARDRR